MSDLVTIKAAIYQELATGLQALGTVTRRLQSPTDTLPAGAFGLHIGVPDTSLQTTYPRNEKVEDTWTLTLGVLVGSSQEAAEARLLHAEDAVTAALMRLGCCALRFQSAERTATQKEVRSILTYTGLRTSERAS